VPGRKRSKKPSGTTAATSTPLEVFLDENRDSPVLVSALSAHGIVGIRFRDMFARGALDEEWVPVVVARGLPILTSDRGRGDGIMIPTLLYYRATAFIVGPGLSLLECAAALAEHARWIESARQRNPPPLLLYVGKATITAHDPRGGRRLEVLRNGKLREPEE
jgi:PIN like domain